jgi:hypothetical protein
MASFDIIGHYEFQHFIVRFNKIFYTLWKPLKEGIRGESRGTKIG